MTDEVYQPSLSPKEAQDCLDLVYNIQIDEIPRADLGEDGPRRIPLTTARQAALAVFYQLGGRKGLDLRCMDIDSDTLGEIVDEATDIIGQAFNLGEGPIDVDVARAINDVHQKKESWQVGFNTATGQFTYLQYTSGVPDTAVSCQRDSLYAAIMDSRNSAKESK